MIPGSEPPNIDLDCNCWDYIRWIFVIWTFFTPMICLVLNLIYGYSILWLIGTFFIGIMFLIISHCILSRLGTYKSTYEMVEEEIEFGAGEHQQAQRGYTMCDGCDVELSASDDTFEKNGKCQHIICSDCYNVWMDGFVKLDFSLTQDWRKQIEHILCPICDQVITDDGKLNLNKISRQIENIKNNKHPNSINVNINSYTSNESEGSTKSTKSSKSNANNPNNTQMIIKTVDLSQSSQSINININNIQSATHITHSSPNNTNSDTSHSNFEMISTTDFLGTAN